MDKLWLIVGWLVVLRSTNCPKLLETKKIHGKPVLSRWVYWNDKRFLTEMNETKILIQWMMRSLCFWCSYLLPLIRATSSLTGFCSELPPSLPASLPPSLARSLSLSLSLALSLSRSLSLSLSRSLSLSLSLARSRSRSLSLSYLLCSFCNPILLFAQPAQCVLQLPAAISQSTRVAHRARVVHSTSNAQRLLFASFRAAVAISSFQLQSRIAGQASPMLSCIAAAHHRIDTISALKSPVHKSSDSLQPYVFDRKHGPYLHDAWSHHGFAPKFTRSRTVSVM